MLATFRFPLRLPLDVHQRRWGAYHDSMSLFFFNYPPTTSVYTLSLHDALPIFRLHGVPSSKIEVVGLGESNPIATNATDEGRALNRRVEFYLSSIPEAIGPSIRGTGFDPIRSEEHTSELQSLRHLVCRLLLEKK